MDPIFTVMLWTGMRVGEITGLRWEDIDLEEGTISVNHTLVYFDRGGSERCGFAVNTPKTKAGERTIPMLPKVKEAFIMEKEYQEEVGLSCKAVVDGYTDFIFINRFGDTQHQGTLNKALRRIIRDCMRSWTKAKRMRLLFLDSAIIHLDIRSQPECAKQGLISRRCRIYSVMRMQKQPCRFMQMLRRN